MGDGAVDVDVVVVVDVVGSRNISVREVVVLR